MDLEETIMDPITLLLYGTIWAALYLGGIYLVFGGAG